jgi:hypothetical protein
MEGGIKYRRNGFHGGQNRHFRALDAYRFGHVYSVLRNVAFIFQARLDVDRRIGNEQRPRVRRNIKGEDMAHAPVGPQATFSLQDSRH